MKFEINDKTGMVNYHMYVTGVVSDNVEEKYEICTSEYLEQILQAVKKTQEKILNKQIQEIQDSKKEYVIHQLDETKKLYKQQKDKIEQNQKIVDEIKRHYDLYENTEWTATDEYSNIITELIKNVTGKDIKDL